MVTERSITAPMRQMVTLGSLGHRLNPSPFGEGWNGGVVKKNIIDELIEMAEGLICLNSEEFRKGLERDEQAVLIAAAKFHNNNTSNMRYLICPHCKMLKRLRALKAEKKRARP